MRIRLAGMTVIAVIGVVAMLFGVSGGLAAPPAHVNRLSQKQSPAQQAPLVDAGAFRGEGKLAFVWGGKQRQVGVAPGGRLYVLDGANGTLRRVTRFADIAAPAWSPDGRWLAFTRVTPVGRFDERGRLWLMRANGSDAHPVPLPSGQAGDVVYASSFAWSPGSDTLAATTDTTNALWVVPAQGKPRNVIPHGSSVLSFDWSPDGTMLAFTGYRGTPAGNGVDLSILRLATGRVIRRLHEPGPTGTCLQMASWWPDGRGLLYWVDPWCSASIAADGMSLMSIPLHGGHGRPLMFTLGYRDWLRWSPSGHTLLLVAGRWRGEEQYKHLALCEPLRGTCRTLPNPAGRVSLDPAWSPNGRQIAFVRAAAQLSRTGYSGWPRTRTLWLMAANGTGAHELRAAGHGVYDPTWLRDGRRLLYAGGGAIRMIDANGRHPVELVSPIPAALQKATFYYGHVDWTNMLAWHR